MICVAASSFNKTLPRLAVRVSVFFEGAVHLGGQTALNLVLMLDHCKWSSFAQNPSSLERREEICLLLAVMISIGKCADEPDNLRERRAGNFLSQPKPEANAVQRS